MDWIWVISSSSRHNGPPGFWPNVAVAPPDQAIESIHIGPESAVIVEAAGPQDEERIHSLIERTRGIAPVWVYEEGATVASSLRWMKAGAAHVAAGPDELETAMAASEAAAGGPRERQGLLIGRSRAIKRVEAEVAQVANHRCNLLIEGETGTGKEVVARLVQTSGNRNRGPWVAVNCGAIPETLLEAELFGHVRGAFTGAIQSRAGKFEAANRGTIFLDEIGDMPLGVQAKLLRVIQERELERLGGNERVRLDVRVIAATNANLAAKVKDGTFRQDLYYRLNVFRIVLPPLRERMEDVAPLAQHFLDRICAAEKLSRKVLDPSTLEALVSHTWPGNVRELENAIETATIVSGSRNSIFPSDLRLGRTEGGGGHAAVGAGIALPAEGLDYQRALEEFEKNLLTQALLRTRGNKTAAADLLGLKRTTLAAKMRVLDARRPRLVA